uniref:G protein-coupled receptor 142 n=1 Tax=Neogobius melanostomus TaxID=47308 RepID=A0A8C6SJX2_9GOBI
NVLDASVMSWSDGSDPDALRPGSDPDLDPGRSRCVLGVIPVVYYTVLLCVGLPVNCLALAALCRLCARSKSPLYAFLVSMTTADMLAQVSIVLVDFLLETAVFHRAVPLLLLRVVSAAEFGANHASIWAAVPLTVDRYAALCHPLLHRRLRSPTRTRRTIGVVILLALASGIPFFYWPDLWRTQTPPTARDAALIWSHVTIIYFLPCSIFLTLNARIVWTLRHRERTALSRGPRTPYSRSTPHRAPRGTRGAFSLLWGPRVVALLLHLHLSTVNRSWGVHLLYDLANMAAMLNTALNLLLYCATSRPIRRAAHDVVCDIIRNALLHWGAPLRLYLNSLHVGLTRSSDSEVSWDQFI